MSRVFTNLPRAVELIILEFARQNKAASWITAHVKGFLQRLVGTRRRFVVTDYSDMLDNDGAALPTFSVMGIDLT